MKQITSIIFLGWFMLVRSQAQDTINQSVVDTIMARPVATATTSESDDMLADLVKESATESKNKVNYIIATFKSARIINTQSIEMTGVGNMGFMVIHHFGQIWDNGKNFGDNASQAFGFNAGLANTYISFDYSFLRWLNVGLAMAGTANYEGWLKLRLLSQQTGKRNIPVSIGMFLSTNVYASTAKSPDNLFWNRFNSMGQLLVARKFTEALSVQLTPTWVHRNFIPYGPKNDNDVFNVGIAMRYKITHKQDIAIEYSRQLNGWQTQVTSSGSVVNYVPDMLSIGYDYDTGGHIFQIFISNTSNATNFQQFSQNLTPLGKGFSFGFNLNRSYAIRKTVSTP